MIVHSLNGQWTLYQQGDDAPIPAQVPGCVHLDLLRAGHIGDPFYRDAEQRLHWIGETDWRYVRVFSLTEQDMQHERLLLRCAGLDTLATIFVNGTLVGQADNMYRTWEFDVKPSLKVGENRLEIAFAAPMPYLRQQEAEKGAMLAWNVGADRLNSGGWLRKQPSNFGWDWGPQLVTSGIWRAIDLLLLDAPRLRDVHIAQEHRANRADLTVTLRTEAPAEGLALRVWLAHESAVLAEQTIALTGTEAQALFTVEQPRLWWPRGLGEQPLYDVQVQLLDAQQQVVDERSLTIGLRTLRLERHADEWGESFQFEANGVPFFAKGANWIPADALLPRLTPAQYERLIKATADANMNMLRVWGGGIYEEDVFYELCDQYGLAVWQDFMFACGTYPAEDAAFMENARQEAIENVQRIRHHACLALWCGNNEIEEFLSKEEAAAVMSWESYSKLFDDMLAQVVREHDPQRDYWPGSPHTPIPEDRPNVWNPTVGDAHLWAVWHGKEPFEWYRSAQHRFISEFGFQSFPEPQTVYSFTAPQDRNLTSYVMEHHQRSGIGNSTMVHYLLEWFRLPTSFEMALWLSQIVQSLAMSYAIEHWRRNMPRTMGALYWQLNDCWPAPSWSSLDYFGNWKAFHHIVKRLYAPLLLTAVEDARVGTATVFLSSDRQEHFTGVVRWELANLAGEVLRDGQFDVQHAPRSSQQLRTLDVQPELAQHGARNVLLWLELLENGAVVAETLVLFARPKHMELHSPKITHTLEMLDAQHARLTLTTDAPALWTWLHSSQALHASDNFFHLRPGRPRTITLRSAGAPLDAEALHVQSLRDTYA